uniref:Uncharacterized protein n=1 Tax=Panagrolaimus sp. JU765 TaxID=591449 RepID=A0AC34Q2B1_9BILA
MKSVFVVFLLLTAISADDFFSNIANSVAQKSEQLANTVSKAVSNAGDTVQTKLNDVFGNSDSQSVSGTLSSLVNNVSTTKITLPKDVAAVFGSDNVKKAYASAVSSIKNKTAVIDGIKNFNNGKNAKIAAFSQASDSGRAEISNYIVNSLNDGTFNPGDLIAFSTSKLNQTEASQYLAALADSLAASGY